MLKAIKNGEAFEQNGKIYYYPQSKKPYNNIFPYFITNSKKEGIDGVIYPTQKPMKLLEIFIQCLSNEGDVVLDCFMGSGTTCVVTKKLNRKYIGIDINPDSIEITQKRLDAINDMLI